MIKLSVVIPTFNRRHVLERTLPTLEAQDLPPNEYEVIVVVDGSTDGTDELLRSWKPRFAFRALKAPHRGAGAARNVGIRGAVGKLVLFLDDDLLAVPELLRLHCESHSDSGPQVVHGPILISPDSAKTMVRYIIERFYEKYYNSLKPEMELRYPERIGSSISMLSSMVNSSMPRQSLLQCGGFDEEILAAEDLELGLRLWKMGLPLRWCTAAQTYEHHVKSSQNYLRYQAMATGPGDLRATRKHPEYRPYSLMASFATTKAGKKWLRQLTMRFPISPVPLLALPLGLEKWFYDSARLRGAGVRLFHTAERVAVLRSAFNAIGSWKELENEFGRRVPALLYHHVGPSRPGTIDEWTVSCQQFEREVQWLAKQGYVGIRPSDWLRWLREGKGLPEKPILLTFDDAYADTAENALPILAKYGFGAAVFVVTQRLGATNTWDEIQGYGTLQLMTPEQIRYWAGQGIEFGAHSRTHADLTKLSAQELQSEVAGSKSDLAALLGSPPISFAYPFGEYNSAVCDAVREQFELAFSSEEGVNYLQGDPNLLRRACVRPTDSHFDFILNVRQGGNRKLREWRGKLALRTRMKRVLGLGSSTP